MDEENQKWLMQFLDSVPNSVMYVDRETFDRITNMIPATWRFTSANHPGPNLAIGTRKVVILDGGQLKAA